MKHYFIIFISLLIAAVTTSCVSLDRNPLDEPSTETWYDTDDQLYEAANKIYDVQYWPRLIDGDVKGWPTSYGAMPQDLYGDLLYREDPGSVARGTLNADGTEPNACWNTAYKLISYMCKLLEEAPNATQASQEVIDQVCAEAHFAIGGEYAFLATLFGGVPLYYEKQPTVEECNSMSRASLEEVKEVVYDQLDQAAAVLPWKYDSGSQRATKGAALGVKARFALAQKDYDIAAAAAKEIMDSGYYELYPDYRTLFTESVHYCSEGVFTFARLDDLNATWKMATLPRLRGGYSAPFPSWDLLAAYTCTDGLPIDESPLFDPHDPFKNRDPRLSDTIVPFGETFLDEEFNPDPRVDSIMDYSTNTKVLNIESRKWKQYATFTGLMLKKSIDNDVLDNNFMSNEDYMYIRYAEVLLTYAEAKIELNEIDQSVLDAMNTVRARAYKVDKSETDKYPAFTSHDQATLRKQIRVEWHMEFACEDGVFYYHLLRWGLLPKLLKDGRKQYIMLYPSEDLIEKVINTGNWFWPYAPDIDEDNIPDFTRMEEEGYCQSVCEMHWNDRESLWPIPARERQLNSNLTQNPGY